MIRNLAAKQVTEAQATTFAQYNPLQQQRENIHCHIDSFGRYVELVKKKEAKLRELEDQLDAAVANVVESSASPEIQPLPLKSVLEVFLNAQTRPKTLLPVLTFLKLRGHELNNLINLNPDIEIGKSKLATVKTINNAIRSAAKTDVSGIRMFKDICYAQGIPFKNVDVLKQSSVLHQKRKRSFRSVMKSLPEKEECIQMLTTLQWDPTKSFPL